MTAVNYIGVRVGGGVQVFLTVIKVISVIIVIGVAFFLSGNLPHQPGPVWPSSVNAGLLSAFLAALAASLWAYDGWEDLNLVGSEVKDPQKNFPRALIGGVAFVALIYMLFSAACMKVLPFQNVASSPHIASDVVETVVGHGRGILDYPRDDYLRARFDELFDSQWCARSLCHGTRRNFF